MTNLSANHLPFVINEGGPSPYFDDSNDGNYRHQHNHHHLRTSYPSDMETLDLISVVAPQAQHLNETAKVNEDLAHAPSKGIVKDKDNNFQMYLDVGRFSPKELSVQISNDYIIIEGRHKESQADDVGFVYQHFIRRYELPIGYDTEDIVSQLSSNGVVSITLPQTTSDSKDSIVSVQHVIPNEASLNKNGSTKDAKKKGMNHRVEEEEQEEGDLEVEENM